MSPFLTSDELVRACETSLLQSIEEEQLGLSQVPHFRFSNFKLTRF